MKDHTYIPHAGPPLCVSVRMQWEDGVHTGWTGLVLGFIPGPRLEVVYLDLDGKVATVPQGWDPEEPTRRVFVFPLPAGDLELVLRKLDRQEAQLADQRTDADDKAAA